MSGARRVLLSSSSMTLGGLALACLAASTGCGTARAGGALADKLGVGTSSIAWSEAVGPRVRVRADFEPEEVQRVAGEIEQMMDLLEEVAFPFQERPTTRVEVVLFSREDDYLAGTGEHNPSGHFQDLRLGGIELPPSIFVRGGWDQARRRMLRHELVHRYVDFYYPRAPVWLNEGLAMLYSTLVVEEGRAVIGKRIMSVGKERAPPLPQILALTRAQFHVESPRRLDYDQQMAVAANYLGVWMIAHYLVTRESPWRARLHDYLSGLARGEDEAAAFARTLGSGSVDELESAMLEHFAFTDLMLLETPYAPAPPPPITLRALRATEIDTLNAWYRALNPGADVAAVVRALDQVVAADPRHAEAYFWRGLIARDAQRADDARRDLDAALELEPASPLYLMAVIDQALADRGRRPEPELTARIDALLPALARSARSAPALDTMARALAWRGKTGAALGFAVRATKADVGCASCWIQRAELSWTMGQTAAALAAIDLAIHQSDDQAQVARLRARRSEMVAAGSAPRP